MSKQEKKERSLGKRNWKEVVATLATEVEHYRLQALAAQEGARAAQRGIKRLHRKLEARDAYIKAAEAFLSRSEGGVQLTESNEPVIKAFIEARQKLSYVKKPRPESYLDKLQAERLPKK